MVESFLRYSPLLQASLQSEPFSRVMAMDVSFKPPSRGPNECKFNMAVSITAPWEEIPIKSLRKGLYPFLSPNFGTVRPPV